jgi:hypothetical protein
VTQAIGQVKRGDDERLESLKQRLEEALNGEASVLRHWGRILSFVIWTPLLLRPNLFNYNCPNDK